MTVSTEVTRVIVEGDGVTTSFSYTFPIPGSTATDQTNAELVLLGTDSSITVLADNLWSMTGVGTAVGGTFTYNPGSPLTTGAFLVLNRIVPYTQPTELGTQGAYSPTVVMAALDNIAYQTEQLNTRELQNVRAPITDAALSDLPTADLRANSFLYFDDNGDVSTASSTGGLIGAIILVGTNSTAAARTSTLLLTGSGVSSVTTVNGVTTASIAGGTISVTDGTHTGSNVTTINFTGTGAVVTTTTGPIVNVAVAGGGGSGSGSLVLLEQHTASTSSSLDFVSAFTSTYNTYFIDIVGIVPATQQDLQMQVSTNSGSTFLTATVYNWALIGPTFANGALTFSGSGTTGDTKFVLAGGASQISAQGYISELLSTTLEPTFWFKSTYVSSGNSIANDSYGMYIRPDSLPLNAIRFKAASGNITSGTIRVYGLAKT